MTRFALTLEFDGRPFMGLQRQKHGATVQEAVEGAAHAVTGEDTQMFAAGRTDAGVHAIAMRAHIDIAKPIAPFKLSEALNAHLRPDPVAVTGCHIAPDDWHARFSCTARHYRYTIINRRAPLTWQKGLAWQVVRELNADAMHDAAQLLTGEHDFTTFRSAHCQSQSPVKSLCRLDVIREGDHIHCDVSARSFLHHQVRSMVGCLMLVGRGDWTADDLKQALDAADRQALGLNAPPGGLYFVKADYPGDEA